MYLISINNFPVFPKSSKATREEGGGEKGGGEKGGGEKGGGEKGGGEKGGGEKGGKRTSERGMRYNEERGIKKILLVHHCVHD